MEKVNDVKFFAETFLFLCYHRGSMKEKVKRGRFMSNTEHLLSKINVQYQSFSKGQKKLAAYIKENYDKAAFLTAAKLGKLWESVSLRLFALLHIGI